MNPELNTARSATGARYTRPGRSMRTGSGPSAISPGGKDVFGQLTQAPWSIGLIGLLVYIFAIVSYRFPVGTTGAIVTIAGALLLLPVARGIPRPFQILALFLLWVFFTSVVSAWSSRALSVSVEFSKVVAVVIAASIVLAKPRAVIPVMGWFLACFILFPVRGAIVGGDTLVGRMVWNYIYANPNDLAVLTLLALGVALALVRLKWRQGWVRPLLYISIALQLWVIVRTQSRGAALGLVMVAVSTLMITPPKLRRKLLLRGAILAALSIPFIPKESLDRYLGGTFSPTEEIELDRAQRIAYSSKEERLRINAASWKMAAASPVMGVGFGAFPLALSQRAPDLGEKDTHNTYLNVLCETGVPGLVLLLWFLVACGQEVLRGLRVARKTDLHAFQALAMFSAATIGFWTAALFGSYIKLVPPLIVMALLVAFARSLQFSSSPVLAGRMQRDRLHSPKQVSIT